MTITEDLHMLLYVALGGALGSVGRYLVAGSLKGVGGTDFPWHMIAVNTLGCILVGFFVAVLYVKLPHPRWINLFYWGFIGGFTAFSSFIKEGMHFGIINNPVVKLQRNCGLAITTLWLAINNPVVKL